MKSTRLKNSATVIKSIAVDRKTNIIFTASEAVPLRALAQSLGILISRGTGSHEMGNIRGLMTALSNAYAQKPDLTKRVINSLINKKN